MDNVPHCPICDQYAQHLCTGCKSVFYCTKEHQKQHWKTHKEDCRPFKECRSPELGRFLQTTRPVSQDEILFAEGPLLVGPKFHEDEQYYPICLGCYKPTEGQCPTCNYPLCAPACPGRRAHKAECRVLQMDKTIPVRLHIILPLRCLLLQRISPGKWQQLLSLESHLDQRGPGTETYNEIEEFIVKPLTTHYLSKLDNESIIEKDEAIIHRICGILDVNGLDIRLPTGLEIIGLYPTFALMEHSCISSTKHYLATDDQLFRLTVRASKDLKPGDNLSTMYTHALWGTAARREHLKLNKYFMCQCERCSDPTELGSYLSGIKCLNEINENEFCGGTQLPISPLDEDSEWRCDKCPMGLTAVQASELIRSLGEEIDFIQHEYPAVKPLEDLLSKLETILHSNHYHCYGIKHSLIQLYGYQQGYLHKQISMEKLDRKIDMCDQLLNVTAKIDPGAGRLVLFSAVIQLEKEAALVARARRKLEQNPPCITPDELLIEATLARSLLTEALHSLQHEKELEAAIKLRRLINEANRQLDRWLTEAAINIQPNE